MSLDTANYINHIAIVADASASMRSLAHSVVKVTDSVRAANITKPYCTIFVQSTSYNRNLIGGTRVMVLR